MIPAFPALDGHPTQHVVALVLGNRARDFLHIVHDFFANLQVKRRKLPDCD
jgi:hypothetical protein